MQRSWESGTGGLRPGTEMVGGIFLSRPRPYMGCSTWESVSQSNIFIMHLSLLQRVTFSINWGVVIITKINFLLLLQHKSVVYAMSCHNCETRDSRYDL